MQKSVKDIKTRSLSNIAFLKLSFKHRFKHGSSFWPLVIMVTGSKCCINAHCWRTVCASIPVQLPCLLGEINQWRVPVIVAVHSLMINPGHKKCTLLRDRSVFSPGGMQDLQGGTQNCAKILGWGGTQICAKSGGGAQNCRLIQRVHKHLLDTNFLWSTLWYTSRHALCHDTFLCSKKEGVPWFAQKF